MGIDPIPIRHLGIDTINIYIDIAQPSPALASQHAWDRAADVIIALQLHGDSHSFRQPRRITINHFPHNYTAVGFRALWDLSAWKDNHLTEHNKSVVSSLKCPTRQGGAGRGGQKGVAPGACPVEREGWGPWNVESRSSFRRITFLLLGYHGNCWGKQSLSLKPELRPTTVWKFSFKTSSSSHFRDYLFFPFPYKFPSSVVFLFCFLMIIKSPLGSDGRHANTRDRPFGFQVWQPECVPVTGRHWAFSKSRWFAGAD